MYKETQSLEQMLIALGFKPKRYTVISTYGLEFNFKGFNYDFRYWANGNNKGWKVRVCKGKYLKTLTISPFIKPDELKELIYYLKEEASK
jgi:hypothetical protein